MPITISLGAASLVFGPKYIFQSFLYKEEFQSVLEKYAGASSLVKDAIASQQVVYEFVSSLTRAM